MSVVNSIIGSGDNKNKTVETSSLTIQGHLLKWRGVVIQISNISLISTAEVPPPGFPLFSIVLALAGIVLCEIGSRASSYYYSNSPSGETVFGIVLLIAAACWVCYWYYVLRETKGKKYLNILLNSGYTYSILFNRDSFMNTVLDVFENIFKDGAVGNTNYFIDFNRSEVKITGGALVNDGGTINNH